MIRTSLVQTDECRHSLGKEDGWMVEWGQKKIFKVTQKFPSYCWACFAWKVLKCRRFDSAGGLKRVGGAAYLSPSGIRPCLHVDPPPLSSSPAPLLTLRCMRHTQSWRPSVPPTSLHSCTPQPGFTICFGSPSFCLLSPPWSSCVLSTVQPPSSFAVLVRPCPLFPKRLPFPLCRCPLTLLSSPPQSPRPPLRTGGRQGPPNLLVLLLTAGLLPLSSFKVFLSPFLFRGG